MTEEQRQAAIEAINPCRLPRHVLDALIALGWRPAPAGDDPVRMVIAALRASQVRGCSVEIEDDEIHLNLDGSFDRHKLSAALTAALGGRE